MDLRKLRTVVKNVPARGQRKPPGQKNNWVTPEQIDKLSQLIEHYYSVGIDIRIADVTKILYPVSTNKGDDIDEGHAKLKPLKKNT